MCVCVCVCVKTMSFYIFEYTHFRIANNMKQSNKLEQEIYTTLCNTINVLSSFKHSKNTQEDF